MTAESSRTVHPEVQTWTANPRTESMSSISTEIFFDESQCLFCNEKNTNLSHSITHMSKAHGFHLNLDDLLVDIVSLLSYIHLLISECHECIYCGTQRYTTQAIQQHMMAKGHCKYDLTDEHSELQGFFEQSSSKVQDESRMNLIQRLESSHSVTARSQKSRSSKRSNNSDAVPIIYEDDQMSDTRNTYQDGLVSDFESTAAHTSNALSTRVLKQEQILNNQLSQLRAGDRRSLAHLPLSQQRALLAAHHKQTEQARRTEQTYRGHLDSAGNKFGRLSTIRLIRKPPHTGNIHSLNR